MADNRWDYTELARHYDKRGDYSDDAIDNLLAVAKPGRATPIADIGAGTGKLAKLLLARGYSVLAVEPNAAMRECGIGNTNGQRIEWSVGTGEETGLPDHSADLVTFGSSFNVTDRPKTLKEVARIARPHGWFACMWNHRDLDDEIQRLCERVIVEYLPGYSYGSRREDQTEVIRASGLFQEPQAFEGRTVRAMSLDDFMVAWQSHATLQRQAGDAFPDILNGIRSKLAKRSMLAVPYTTRVWCARLR
jgi:ubiquinone/menaquinone biosynthesis C-methylase UbiE